MIVIQDLESYIRKELDRHRSYVRYYELIVHDITRMLNLTMYIEHYEKYDDDIEDFIQSLVDYACHHVAYELFDVVLVHCIYDDDLKEKQIIVELNKSLPAVEVSTEKSYGKAKVTLPYTKVNSLNRTFTHSNI